MDGGQNIPLDTDRMIGRIEGPIGWMTFNNPERRNAVSLEMWQGMAALLEHFEQESAVRVVVLRGAGQRAFVAGADISQFEQQRSSPETIAAYDRISKRAGDLLASCSKPTIAMIHGYCIGGGLGIAVGCDLRIADETAKFAIPAARLGLGYDAPGVKKLMDVVGPAYTKDIFFTARHFSAAEALTMGLVNWVVPEAELEGQVRSYCAMIADNAPLTMRALKRTVAELSKASSKVDYEACARWVAECFASQDYIEGRRAFMEKRRPQFRGE
ncbi:MAG: enoyl-CoA hydratase/isomerase family protein [Acetobacteraceae bacterium]|nr:enoyl-CoA hydratase/isomerase family protein [Acetobacteraceae bacterium]